MSGHVCIHGDRWQKVEHVMDRVETWMSKHDEKFFTGNGKEGIVPNVEKRLSALESSILPRDDVREMLQAFKAGKSICYAIGLVAAVGAAAMLFWHFFKPVQYVVR